METCPYSGKICFDKKSAESARNARMNPRRTKHRKGKPPKYLRIYECPTCQSWHLTSAKAPPL